MVIWVKMTFPPTSPDISEVFRKWCLYVKTSHIVHGHLYLQQKLCLIKLIWEGKKSINLLLLKPLAVMKRYYWWKHWDSCLKYTLNKSTLAPSCEFVPLLMRSGWLLRTVCTNSAEHKPWSLMIPYVLYSFIFQSWASWVYLQISESPGNFHPCLHNDWSLEDQWCQSGNHQDDSSNCRAPDSGPRNLQEPEV